MRIASFALVAGLATACGGKKQAATTPPPPPPAEPATGAEADKADSPAGAGAPREGDPCDGGETRKK